MRAGGGAADGAAVFLVLANDYGLRRQEGQT